MAETGSIDRLSPTRRPSGGPMGYQKWRDLLFIHWRVPVDVVRRWIPAELTIDTWDGDAWIALVPFFITGSRPRWVPPLPGISSFPETNVRTYVHHAGANPGVWFFSLDAATSLGVQVARRFLSLPYYRADMSIRRRDGQIQYESWRRWPGPLGATHSITAEPGSPADVPNTTVDARARPGTLEHFLVERYLLYTATPDGRLLRGQVHHAPYPLRSARVIRLEETMLSANGLIAPDEPAHIVFSDGVDVEIYPIVPPPRPPSHDTAAEPGPPLNPLIE